MKIVFMFLSFLISCSAIEFKQDGAEKFTVGVVPGLTREEVASGVCDSYFWGTFSRACTVNLGDQYKDRSLYDPSHVKITQNYTWSNILMAAVTLGIYTPVSYQVSVYSK